MKVQQSSANFLKYIFNSTQCIELSLASCNLPKKNAKITLLNLYLVTVNSI